MTASENLMVFWRALTARFAAMSLGELALNVGLTVGLLVLGLAASYAVSRALKLAVRRSTVRRDAAKQVTASRVVRLLDAAAKTFIYAIALVLVAGVWGLDLRALATAGPTGRLMALLAHLALLGVATLVLMEVAGYLISHGFGRLASADLQPRRQAQLNTLTPLLKGVVQSAILVVAALMALSEIGVKVGPLLAGAGVLGIAIGFGAQTVVKDFLTGVFLIIEDIVSVGDIVRIGESGGLVEKMTLRTIRLRDFDGTLHVFPYGEAQVVHNLTKSFSYYVFDLQVSYGSDIDRALALMREVGADMQNDPDFAERILEPIEVVGVDSLADSGVVLKARIKTKPIQQSHQARLRSRGRRDPVPAHEGGAAGPAIERLCDTLRGFEYESSRASHADRRDRAVRRSGRGSVAGRKRFSRPLAGGSVPRTPGASVATTRRKTGDHEQPPALGCR